ncbi:MAG: hypothetical protein UU76_C0003G0012 [Parcubacteria group bacterium GW2011_GWC1_41_7]|nr:MAG: hypothetical protein UU76_C0003G0012 [Parcubacteria group bacterium GW2011_GWC1_41_7]
MTQRKHIKNRGLAPLLIAAGIGAIAVIGGAAFGRPILDAAGQSILNGMLHFLDFVLPLVRHVFWWLGGISANAINTFVLMNPFDSATLSPFLWETFKNIAYVVIIFFSLYAGFMWIVGRDSAAKPMIFKLLIIALLINFSFFIAKELFFVSHVVTKSLACSFGQNEKVQPGGEPCSQVGTAIYTGLLMFGDNNLVAGIKGDVEKLSSAESSSRLSQLIFAHLVAFVLFFIFTSIMMILAGMFVGRFLIVSFLVGILPLAIISWASPKNNGHWEEWSKKYLTWLTNIPTLLLFILVGFSIVGVGLGDNFRDKLQANVDTRILMGNNANSNVDANAVKGYAGLIRFFFLVGYYAFAIVYAQQVGGKAAKFGHDFAVGSYLALGGAVRGAAVFKPTRNLLGDRLEKTGKWIEEKNPAFLGIAMRGMGTKMREAGKGMLAQKRERIEKDAKQFVEANKGDPQKLGQYLKNARGDQRLVIAKVIGEKLQRHEELQAVVDHLDQGELSDFLSDERVRKALGTRTGIGKFSSATRKGTPEGFEEAAKIILLLR